MKGGDDMAAVIDRFTTPLLTATETARHLDIPARTLRHWLRGSAAGGPMIHSVPPERRGRPSVPFVAVVEAYVLRSLRALGLSPRTIADAVTEVREQFDTEYGLASRRIATDGVDVFVHHLATDEFARAGDHQLAFRDVIEGYLKYILWEGDDEFPWRLALPRYAGATGVVIDPRFGWGVPVVETSKVPVSAIAGMARAGESSEIVAHEYGLDVAQVEALLGTA